MGGHRGDLGGRPVILLILSSHELKARGYSATAEL